MGWHVVFVIATTFNVLAAALALLVFKPLRLRHFAAVRAELERQSTGHSAPGNGGQTVGELAPELSLRPSSHRTAEPFDRRLRGPDDATNA
jgi:hypothetical protein